MSQIHSQRRAVNLTCSFLCSVDSHTRLTYLKTEENPLVGKLLTAGMPIMT